MSVRFFTIFSTALCTLYFTIPHVQSLTASEFDGFNGERICTDSNTHYKSADYCKDFDERSTADCSSLNLYMKNESNRYDLYCREVVACRVQNEIVACVSGGKSDKYYIIWGYSYPQPGTLYEYEYCFHPQKVRIQDENPDTSTNSGTGTSTSTNANENEE